MVSGKFENKVQQATMSELHAMQESLSEKVEKGTIGFGKRMVNTLAPVLTTGGLAYGAWALDRREIVATLADKNILTGANLSERIQSFNTSNLEIVDLLRTDNNKKGIIAASIAIGAAIPAAIIFNKISKSKQADRLSFVEREMARREQATLEAQYGPALG